MTGRPEADVPARALREGDVVRIAGTWHNLLSAREAGGEVRLTFPLFEQAMSAGAKVRAELRPERKELRT